jgi:hypothetical protein
MITVFQKQIIKLEETFKTLLLMIQEPFNRLWGIIYLKDDYI